MVKNITKFIVGSVFLLFGIMILMVQFNIFNISFWSIINVYWPVGLIASGVLIMMKQKLSAFLFIVFTLTFGLMSNFYIFENSSLSELVMDNYKGGIENSTEIIEYEIKFEGGDLNVYSGFNYELYNVDVETFYPDRSLDISEETKDNQSNVFIGRNKKFEFDSFVEVYNFDKQFESWEVFLNPGIPVSLDIEVSLTNTVLDLSELQIEELDLEIVASSVSVVFGENVEKVSIDIGASSLELEFPEGLQISIDIDGDLLSSDIKGFNKVGDVYLTENFKYDGEYTIVSIDGGASSVTSKFYK